MKIRLSELRSIIREEATTLVEYPGQRDKYRHVPGKNAKGTIYLPTPSAMALWDNELKGQFSDGMWENSGPRDHWIFWSNMKTAQGAPKLEANQSPIKDSYNLGSLIDVVGDRMINTGKMALAGGTTYEQLHAAEEMPATLAEFMRSKETGSWKYDYVKKYMDHITPELAQKYYAAKYDMGDLKRDLRSIKVAMKNYHHKSAEEAPKAEPPPAAAPAPEYNPAMDEPNVIQQ